MLNPECTWTLHPHVATMDYLANQWTISLRTVCGENRPVQTTVWLHMLTARLTATFEDLDRFQAVESLGDYVLQLKWRVKVVS